MRVSPHLWIHCLGCCTIPYTHTKFFRKHFWIERLESKRNVSKLQRGVNRLFFLILLWYGICWELVIFWGCHTSTRPHTFSPVQSISKAAEKCLEFQHTNTHKLCHPLPTLLTRPQIISLIHHLFAFVVFVLGIKKVSLFMLLFDFKIQMSGMKKNIAESKLSMLCPWITQWLNRSVDLSCLINCEHPLSWGN